MKRLALCIPVMIFAVSCNSTDNVISERSTVATEPSTSDTAVEASTTTEPAVEVPAAPDTTVPASTEAPGSGSLSNPIPLGSPADIGDGWTLTVLSYNPNANALVARANQFNDPAPPGKVYVMFTLRVSYNGEKDKDSPFISLKAVGRSLESYENAYVVEPEPDFDISKDVFRGASHTGNVVMLVDSADAIGLIAYGSASFGNDDVYFATS